MGQCQPGSVIETPGAAPLQLTDAEKLSDLPMGVYDCEVDAGDNVVFTMNLWGGRTGSCTLERKQRRWFKLRNSGLSYAWLGMVKARGDYTIQVPGNSIFTLAMKSLWQICIPATILPFKSDLPFIAGKEGIVY